MMNFYEEFGVRNDAPGEEIRQAYKTLARVLHPDSQTDEKLRVAAVCQMKRLHEILDILMDPQKRRAYDESLAAGYLTPVYQWAPPPPAQPSVNSEGKFNLAQAALRHWFWILIAGVILGSGFWYITARVPTLAEFTPGQLPVAAGTGEAALPEEDRGAFQAEPPGSRHASDAPASVFAGNWLYTSTAAKSGQRRSPLFIEFRLTEKDGMLDGDYRARYAVPWQPAPQSVMFQARGKSPVGASATLAWTSDDGAGGEMDLFLDTPDSLQVTWWTTKLGRHTDLGSDAATLRRR